MLARLCSIDVRGLTLWGSQLYLTSAYITEPNKNMPAEQDIYKGLTPWGGIVRIGEYGQLTRSTTTEATLVRGFDGRRNMHSFVFAGNQVLYALEDVSAYNRVPRTTGGLQLPDFLSDSTDDPGWRNALSGSMMSAAGAELRRPLLTRSRVTVAVVKWAWSNQRIQWVEDPRKVYIDDDIRSIVVRSETVAAQVGAAGGATRSSDIVYATGRNALYRVTPDTGRYTTLFSVPVNQLLRGVAIPPDYRSQFTATPTPTRSAAPTPPATRSATRSRTPTDTPKPRVL